MGINLFIVIIKYRLFFFKTRNYINYLCIGEKLFKFIFECCIGMIKMQGQGLMFRIFFNKPVIINVINRMELARI